MTPEEARQQAERDVRQGHQGWNLPNGVHHETHNAYEAERKRQEELLRQQQQQQKG